MRYNVQETFQAEDLQERNRRLKELTERYLCSLEKRVQDAAGEEEDAQ